MGSAHPLSAPYQAFRTADGWVNVGASNQGTWDRLVDALGVPELGYDPRFATNADRMGHLADLVAELSALMAERTTSEWLGAFERAGVPAGPVASVGEMLEHPQTVARRMVVEVEHSRLGRVRSLGCAVKMSGSAGDRGGAGGRPGAGGGSEAARFGRGAPRLGEHTHAVLVEAGWSEDEVADMVGGGVVVVGDGSSPSEV
jgi:crotonobetainyl-CoA:carnitine CoA-transferase CaiB-like acyl-CoA transferase